VRLPTRARGLAALVRGAAAFAAGAAAVTPAVRAVLVTMAVVAPARARAQGAAASAQADRRAREQRAELERVRHERAALEQRMRELQSTAHDLDAEVANLERQADATARLVTALDRQLLAIDDEMQETTQGLARAEREYRRKSVMLQRRLVDIYKRGPLYTPAVLLSAESFGDVVSRYKYLRELALHDQSLVRRVKELRDGIVAQRALLVRLQSELRRNREEKTAEEQRLRDVESQRGVNLAHVRRLTEGTRRRLEQVARDERRLGDLIGAFEAERRRAEARPNAAPVVASNLRTSDLGRLDWPVDGRLLYRFGRVVNANNTRTRWNGVGIAAAEGTQVRAVATGTVVAAAPIGTYGNTVIVQHGGGDYSVYGSLSRVDVRVGAGVAKGQPVGTVGTADPDMPPHLHFEVRPQGRAVDPLEWLRARR
jgi:septal ring factor EnvC (AmiA/AmiB activator)